MDSEKDNIEVIEIPSSPKHNSFFETSQTDLLGDQNSLSNIKHEGERDQSSLPIPEEPEVEDDEKQHFCTAFHPKNILLRFKRGWSWWFILYFSITVIAWGTQDFLLSYMASKEFSLGTGDTLAFLAIGQLLGMILSKIVLWRWKRHVPIEKLVHPIHETAKVSPLSDPKTVELGGALVLSKDQESGEKKVHARKLSRFASIRSLLKTPVFLTDAYKLCFISGVIGSISPLGYYMLSVNGGQASAVAPLISLYVIVPAILGLVFLKERKSPIKLIGIAIAITAVVLFAMGGGGTNWALLTGENVMWFLFGFLGWGISYFIRGLAATKVVDFGHMLLMATAGLMFGNYCLIMFWFGVDSLTPTLSHLLTILAGMSAVIGDLGFFLLSKEGKEASKVVPLTGTYILLPSILGFVFLHDSVTVLKIVAICLSLVALVLLGAA